MANDLKNGLERHPGSGIFSRLFRIVLFVLSGIVLIVLLLVISFRVFVTGDRIKTFAIEYCREHLSRKLEIEHVSFNLLSGLSLSNIKIDRLNPSAPPDNFLVQNAKIKKVELGYSLDNIFDKKIQIIRIIIDTPELNLYSAGYDTTEEEISEPDTLESLNLPLSFDVKLVSLRDAKFNFITLQDSLKQSIYVGDFNLDLEELSVPKGDLLKSTNNISGLIRLGIDRNKIAFEQIAPGKHFYLSTLMDLQANIKVNGWSQLVFETNIIADELDIKTTDDSLMLDGQLPLPLRLMARVRSDLSQGHLETDELSLSLDKAKWLEVHLAIDSLYSQPVLDVRIVKSYIPSTRVIEIADSFFHDYLPASLELPNHNSYISFEDSWVRGALPNRDGEFELDFSTRLRIENLVLNDKKNKIYLKNLGIQAGASGNLNQQGLMSFKANSWIQYDSLSYLTPDTIPVFCGSSVLKASTTLNTSLVPTEGQLDLKINNLLGSQITGACSVSGTQLETLEGYANIKVSNLDSQNLPNIPVRTIGRMDLNFNMSSLDSIGMDLKLNTDSLFIKTDPFYALSPVELTARSVASVNKNVFNIDSLILSLNDFVKTKICLTLHDKDISFTIPALVIDHANLYQQLPTSIREPLYDLQVSGSTHLQGKGQATIGSEMMKTLILDGKLLTDDTNLRYPSRDLDLGGIKIDLGLKAVPDSIWVDFRLNVDTFTSNAIREKPYTNNKMSFKVITADFSQIFIKDGYLDLYEFGLQSHFSGKIDSVANNLKGKLALHIQQSSKDTILVTNDLALQGGLILKSNIVFDTLTTSIKGSMEIDQLGLYLPNNVSIEGIRSNVQFSQSFDLQKMCLICKAEPEILAPSKGAIDHAVYKNYYTGARELSNLKIDKLSLVGYTITDFKSQLKISDGWIEIPYIHTRLYGGNMLGHLFIDLAEGDIQNASYILSAHFTNVNSELLLPFSSEKEQASIINGNMDLYGTGIDPTYGVDIGGHFYITKIGPKVVSNLLKAMNPKGTDAGIGITQKLLSWGFKPRVLSFFIGQGYMYPSIQLSHPWYFPARLSGGRIEFSRLPVDFFVQLAMKPTLGAGTHE